MAEIGSLRPTDVVPLSARPAVLLPPDRRDMPEAGAREMLYWIGCRGPGPLQSSDVGSGGINHSEVFLKDIVI